VIAHYQREGREVGLSIEGAQSSGCPDVAL
jgi:hypothetical protein